ncbi:MAG: AbrB/MazE/SpoVT family DNA-binding domain-containing protein [Thermomicrobiales bacterium]|nr:AbrB/MazE/SpoVT family DNA-binding domain-containing protein [Thermomicrobiales bacterium]
MTSIATLQSRGQLTIPKDVREAVHVRPGDTLFCYVDGPSTIRLEVRPRLTWREILDQYSSDESLDVERIRREAQEGAADEYWQRFEGRMSEEDGESSHRPLEYYWEKFAIEGPFDSEKLRAEAEEAAAEEVMGE